MHVRRPASPLKRRLRPVTHCLPDDIYDEATRRYGIEQAKALREQVRSDGLRFEAYIPPGLAEWLLDQVERGVFVDPSEAVFVMLTEQHDLEPHADLREEILRRSCRAALDDPRPGIPHDEVKAWLQRLAETPRAEPAVWRKNEQ
jgi:antitoxin ParD1/3/4